MAMAVSHEPFCAAITRSDFNSAHVATVSCRAHTAWVEDQIRNPWHCWHGRNGYHMFSGESHEPDDECEHDGCDRKWSELTETLSETES
jgi:hypothetical protein